MYLPATPAIIVLTAICLCLRTDTASIISTLDQVPHLWDKFSSLTFSDDEHAITTESDARNAQHVFHYLVENAHGNRTHHFAKAVTTTHQSLRAQLASMTEQLRNMRQRTLYYATLITQMLALFVLSVILYSEMSWPTECSVVTYFVHEEHGVYTLYYLVMFYFHGTPEKYSDKNLIAMIDKRENLDTSDPDYNCFRDSYAEMVTERMPFIRYIIRAVHLLSTPLLCIFFICVVVWLIDFDVQSRCVIPLLMTTSWVTTPIARVWIWCSYQNFVGVFHWYCFRGYHWFA